MELADRIQHLRKQHGYTQEELAERLGVSRQAVSKWESRQSIPEAEKIIAMSEFFAVTTDYLLKGVEPAAATRSAPMKSLYMGFVLIFATIAGIWAFTANRFNPHECMLIALAGGAVGLGVALVVPIIGDGPGRKK